MAVKLRLRRLGRKKRPFYRVVAADARAPRDGRFIEEIGYYNPLTDPAEVVIKEDRALYWLQQGAIPTDTVKSLLRRKGIILRFTLMKQGLPAEKIEEEMKKWEVLQLERQRRLEAKKAQEKKAKKEAVKEEKPKEEVAETTEVAEEVETAEVAATTPEETSSEAAAEAQPAEAEAEAKEEAETPETSETKEPES